MLKRAAFLVILFCVSAPSWGALVQHNALQDNAASTTVVAAVGITGTLTGGDNTNTLSTTGPGGSFPLALNFNGSDDAVNISSFNVTGTGTWCWWAKRDTTNTADVVIGARSSSGGNNRMGFSANGTTLSIQLTHSASTVTPTHGVTTTAWHHYAIVRDSSNIVKLYVDGSLVNGDIYSGALSGSASDWMSIGSWVGFSEWFDGQLADVRVYNSDESSNMATIYAEGTSGSSTVPLLQRMQQNQSSIESDRQQIYAALGLSPRYKFISISP
jgi:hypothetical protein